MNPTDPGLFRTRLIYQELDDAGRDAHGRPVVDWVDRFELWAFLRPIQGREAYLAAQVNASRTHQVNCRYRPGFKTKNRLRIKGTDRYLEIDSVLDLEEQHVELQIGCIEKAD